MKRDNKRPFRTSLKYHKEIKDEIETEGRELSDLPINLAQEILRRQFLEISGLEDTSLGIFGKFTSHKDEFVQIVYGNHHCIVVGGKEEENAVEIYDSLANGSTTRKIAHEICHLRRCNKKQLRINTGSLQRQGNGVDCGVFAIALAVELVFGESPEKKLLEPNSVRSQGSFLCSPQQKENKGNQRTILGCLIYTVLVESHSLRKIRKKTKGTL